MCNHDKREEAKVFEDLSADTYQDSRLVGLSYYPFCFVNLSRREITKYLLKSTAEKNWKMA